MLLAQTSKRCNTRKQPQQQEKRGFHLTRLLLEQGVPARDSIVLSVEQETLSKALRSRAMCWIPARRNLVAMLLWISKRTGFYILSLGTEWKELFQGWVDFVKRCQIINMEGNKLWWCESTQKVMQEQLLISLSILCWGKNVILSFFLTLWVSLPQKTEGFHAYRVEWCRWNMHHLVTAGGCQILYNPGSSEHWNQETWWLHPARCALTCPML